MTEASAAECNEELAVYCRQSNCFQLWLSSCRGWRGKANQPNNTDEDRRQNRRIELKFLSAQSSSLVFGTNDVTSAPEAAKGQQRSSLPDNNREPGSADTDSQIKKATILQENSFNNQPAVGAPGALPLLCLKD